MALIKCPECGKNMSDKAKSCPHCGYTKNNSESKSVNLENLKGKWNNKYLLVILVLVVGVYFVFFSKPNSDVNKPSNGTNPSTELKPNANGNYEFNQYGKYFEFPTNYKVYISNDGGIYIGKNIDKDGALIPYILLEKYKNYTDPTAILSELTKQIGSEYSDAKITIDLVSGYIGDKLVYGMQFAYTSSGHLVIDNRYAFLVNNSMYLLTTKEENTNTAEINNASKIVMETLKEVN